MIKLETEYYCHDCPGFEPEVTHINTMNECSTIVFCKHANRCAYLYQTMKTIEAAASLKPECDL